MKRGHFVAPVFALLTASVMEQAYAIAMVNLSNTDASKGLKTALKKGMVSEDEKRIRTNPVASDSAILTKVFGALQ